MKNSVRMLTRTACASLISASLLFLPACKASPETLRWQWSEAAFAGIVDASRLSELSGLAHSTRHAEVFWAINDGADAVKSSVRATEIFAINAQGKIIASLHIDGVANVDWEDITSYQWRGKHYLAIADTGDNGGVRRELAIHVIEEPAVLKPTLNAKPTRSLRFAWKDGARDVESLFASPQTNQFFMVSKKRVPAELFALPFDAPGMSNPTLFSVFEGIEQPNIATMNSKSDYGRYRAQITGADLSPDGRVIALLNYQQITFYAMPERAQRALTPLNRIVLPWLPQAEGIAFSSDGQSLLIGGEQPPVPLIRFERLASDKPE